MKPSQIPETRATDFNGPARWKLPAPLAVVELHMPDGAPIFLRRHGNPKGPRLVLSHCNGMSADTYYPFWSLLTGRFDLVLYDFRNHGWNPVGERRAHNMPTFVRDNTYIASAIDRHFGKRPKIGVFHSMSAAAAILQVMERRDFSALVLFDPPIWPHGRGFQDIRKLASGMADRARQRQDRFGSREELTRKLLSSRVYELLQPGVPELIAQTTLLPARDGGAGYELCCPREYEAHIYDQLYDTAVASDVTKLSCPTKVVGADPTLRLSFLPSVDLSEIVALDYDFVPDSSHFLQLEQPQECVTRLLEFLQLKKLA